jgi:L-asparagine oxygenase
MSKTLAQIQNSAPRELILTRAECAQVSSVVASVAAEYDHSDFYQFSHECWRAAGRLPARLTQALFDLRLGRCAGYLLLRGLPQDGRIPPTPASRERTWSRATLQARKLMCTLLSPLGHVYNFTGKKHPDYIDDVFPIYGDRHAQLGTNQCFLEWHVEDGFHPARADLVSLYCLRGDSAAKTYLCHARDLKLAPQHRRELEQPNYRIHVDPTFAAGSQPEESVVCSVLSAGPDPEILYDPAYMTATTPGAEAALAHLREAIECSKVALELEPGDLLIFDNRRSVHARSAYAPRFDGSDRWLLRGLILESYWKTRENLGDLTGDCPQCGWLNENQDVQAETS